VDFSSANCQLTLVITMKRINWLTMLGDSQKQVSLFDERFVIPAEAGIQKPIVL